MSEDSLFDSIVRYQGQTPWGRVLDAGAGPHSTGWVAGLDHQGWSGVTADRHMATRIRDRLGPLLDDRGQLIEGDWTDPALLYGQRFDTVFADYLLGAMDGFAPYFQDQLFARLRRHVAGRLYVVGVTPLLSEPRSEEADWLQRLVRLRDACILHAGHRTYREYPQDWVHRSLVGAGYRVAEAWALPIVYRESFVERQLNVALRKLVLVKDPLLVQALTGRIAALRREGLALVGRLDGLRCGADYVVVAQPQA